MVPRWWRDKYETVAYLAFPLQLPSAACPSPCRSFEALRLPFPFHPLTFPSSRLDSSRPGPLAYPLVRPACHPSPRHGSESHHRMTTSYPSELLETHPWRFLEILQSLAAGTLPGCTRTYCSCPRDYYSPRFGYRDNCYYDSCYTQRVLEACDSCLLCY